MKSHEPFADLEKNGGQKCPDFHFYRSTSYKIHTYFNWQGRFSQKGHIYNKKLKVGRKNVQNEINLEVLLNKSLDGRFLRY